MECAKAMERLGDIIKRVMRQVAKRRIQEGAPTCPVCHIQATPAWRCPKCSLLIVGPTPAVEKKEKPDA